MGPVLLLALVLPAELPGIATSTLAEIEPPAFGVDPLGDGALIAASAAVAILLEAIVRTSELRPQEPVDPSVLLPIDRKVALSTKAIGDSLPADISVALAGTYAALDITLTGFLDRGESWLAYLFLYFETAALNLAVQNVVKIAVRRPRPSAYRELRETGMVSSDTNSALSFYSGHTATTAALTATASYLAFERSQLEGWITLGLGLALTAGVGYQRVASGTHFPTDVIAGALAGASIGILVPHLHRTAPLLRVEVQSSEEGTLVAVGGIF